MLSRFTVRPPPCSVAYRLGTTTKARLAITKPTSRLLSSTSRATATSEHQLGEIQDARSTMTSLPDFDNARASFDSKSTGELMRAALVFRLCGILPVQYAEPLLTWSRKILGNRITDWSLKATLYGHFCAGQDEERIQPVVESLLRNGIGGILDYAAESDVEQSEELWPQADFNQPAREYSYESEEACDRHVQVFRSCIRSVANVSPDGFAAVKVTALGNPALLERMSLAIVEAKNLFAKFDANHDGSLSRDEFETGYRLFFDDADDKLEEVFHTMDPLDTGKVDYITWAQFLTPKDLPSITSACRQLGPLGQATPTEEEIQLMEKMQSRAHALAKEAAHCGTRLLIDAEQVRFQPAIDNLTLDLQQTYNATAITDSPVVFNTYQCYLKDALERIQTDVERSERFGYHFACKLVRGAYMESERERATNLLYPTPIQETIEETHQCYNDAVAYLLRHRAGAADSKLEVMCATHNQESIEKAIQVMSECGISRSDKVLHFAQLYGMSDNLTYNLGKHGFRVFKYVPYGEVSEVMPYLIRRAQENSAMLGNASREVQLLKQELGRRAGAVFSFGAKKEDSI